MNESTNQSNLESNITTETIAVDAGQASSYENYSGRQKVQFSDGFVLGSGQTISPVQIEYETWGTLTPERDNALLICHALSGDSHVARTPGTTDKAEAGWWDKMVGPGLPIDTDRYFIICSNVLGGCSGSTGAGSIDPATGHRYGLDFPIVTIEDMVNAQAELLTHLGIDKLLGVVGGSLGGMQALAWAKLHPQRICACVASATTWRISAQSIAFNEVGRRAILADPHFKEGHYAEDAPPTDGLAIARMIGHLTYLSDEAMSHKFGRRLRGEARSFGFETDFEVESYLQYQGNKFVDRFDASAYLYLTKAMDYFSLAESLDGLHEEFANTSVRFLLMSFSSDWLFPTYQTRELNDALVAGGAAASFAEIESGYGHDAFLLEDDTQGAFIAPFLARAYAEECGR